MSIKILKVRRVTKFKEWIIMPKHISKQQQIKILLSEIEQDINRDNVDLALPILRWTKDKIDLSSKEKRRVDKYNRTNKVKGRPRRVKRGDVYYAHLGNNIGSEQNGYRPVLVVQEGRANVTSPTVVVIPLTAAYDKNGNPKRILASHLVIKHSNLKKDSIIKAEFTRSISKNRLRNFICRLDSGVMSDIDNRIKILLDLT